jgi:hypothetical protein
MKLLIGVLRSSYYEILFIIFCIIYFIICINITVGNNMMATAILAIIILLLHLCLQIVYFIATRKIISSIRSKLLIDIILLTLIIISNILLRVR